MWWFKLRALFRRGLERDLEDELRAHLEMRAEDLRKSGVSVAQADWEARRQFGNVTLTREQARGFHVFGFLETIAQDALYAARILSKHKGFTITALLTLALAVGANGAIFSLIEAVVLRPLIFPDADQLYVLFGTTSESRRTSISPLDLEEWRKGTSFEAIAGLQGQSVTLTRLEQPKRVIGGFVSPEYFPLLGIAPMLGRTFLPEEDSLGARGVVVLGYAFWQNQLGGDVGVLGRSLILNGEPDTVVGVMPARFQPPFFAADLWLPSHFYPNYSRDRGRTCLLGFARLRPGVTREHAQAGLDTITGQLGRAYPVTNHDRGGVLIPFRAMMTQNLRPMLAVLAGGALCLLLIGCANISGLLVARAASRRQEIAIRGALGASRWRIARQLVTESIVLSVCGAVLGAGIAVALSRSLSRSLFDWPQGTPPELNLPVVVFLAAVSLFAGILFGIAPVLFARDALRERSLDHGSARWRNALVVAQVAAAFLLLAGVGTISQNLRSLLGVDPGFDGRHVLTLEYRLPAAKYASDEQQMRFHDAVLERVRALHGVEAAGIVRGLPFSGNGGVGEIRLPDRPSPPPNKPYVALYNSATAGYFETVRIPLKAGRTFRVSDNAHQGRVCVVSDSFVRRYWPDLKSDADAIGRHVLVPNRDAANAAVALSFVPATIVGVVGTVRHNALDEPETPQLYVPYAQDPMIFASLAVRTKGDPLRHVKDVQRAVWSVDKDQAVWKIRTLQSMVDQSMNDRETLVELLLAFSAFALLLAAMGIYGVIGLQVTQRTAEIGVRMAVGAGRGHVLILVLKNGAAMTAAGLAIGALLSPALGLVLRTQFAEARFGVSVGVIGLLTLVSLLAAGVPAWRATRIDPVGALRGG